MPHVNGKSNRFPTCISRNHGKVKGLAQAESFPGPGSADPVESVFCPPPHRPSCVPSRAARKGEHRGVTPLGPSRKEEPQALGRAGERSQTPYSPSRNSSPSLLSPSSVGHHQSKSKQFAFFFFWIKISNQYACSIWIIFSLIWCSMAWATAIFTFVIVRKFIAYSWMPVSACQTRNQNTLDVDELFAEMLFLAKRSSFAG